MRKLSWVLGLIAMWAQPATACEPCQGMWDMNKTISQADYIIVGKRVTPKSPNEGNFEGPAYVKISVDSVLKGDMPEKEITTDAWHGMCAYGIVTEPDVPHVMLLTKFKDRDYYQPLNYGCAVRVLPVNEQHVTTPDGEMTMEDFKRLLQ